MLKRDELANPDSCLNKAGDDEPIFVLRANDEAAPGIVGAWALAYARQKGGASRMTPEQQAKAREAVQLADNMKRWKRQQRGEPEPQAPSLVGPSSARAIASDAPPALASLTGTDANGGPAATFPDPVDDADRFAGKVPEHSRGEDGKCFNWCTACWREKKIAERNAQLDALRGKP